MLHDSLVGGRDVGGGIGGTRQELETPCLVLDLGIFRDNATRLARTVLDNGAAWRPHIKSHRSPALAWLQQTLGATGVTCGTVGEAQAFVAGGIDDVLIANVLMAAEKWLTVAEMQAEAQVIACIDDRAQLLQAEEAARRTGVEIPLYLEMDVGLRRTGVSCLEDVNRLADEIVDSAHLRLAGLMGYEGHCMAQWPLSKKQDTCAEAVGKVLMAHDALRSRGLHTDVVSCGGTGDYEIVAALEGVTEIQAGGGCMMDVLYDEVFHVDGFDFALAVDTQVVSRPYADTAIVDAGLKAVATHGEVKPRVSARTGVDLTRLSAEHGTLHVSGADDTVVVGDRLSIIPGRIDSTIFLYDRLYVVEEEKVVDELELVRSQR